VGSAPPDGGSGGLAGGRGGFTTGGFVTTPDVGGLAGGAGGIGATTGGCGFGSGFGTTTGDEELRPKEVGGAVGCPGASFVTIPRGAAVPVGPGGVSFAPLAGGGGDTV
jgi:hypothetical protein